MLTMNRPYKRIKQIEAPSGDWFAIQIEHLGGGKKSWVMSRVAVWAVVTAEASDDVVEGIDSIGLGHIEDRLDYFYVHGDDLAPNGMSWRDLFNETPAFNWGLKDISEIAPDSFT
jgi:hypothetical protein